MRQIALRGEFQVTRLCRVQAIGRFREQQQRHNTRAFGWGWPVSEGGTLLRVEVHSTCVSVSTARSRICSRARDHSAPATSSRPAASSAARRRAWTENVNGMIVLSTPWQDGFAECHSIRGSAGRPSAARQKRGSAPKAIMRWSARLLSVPPAALSVAAPGSRQVGSQEAHPAIMAAPAGLSAGRHSFSLQAGLCLCV